MKAAAEFPEIVQANDLPPPSFFNRHAKSIAAIAALAVFAVVGYAVYRLTEEVSYADVLRALETTSPTSIALAIFFTALSFVTLCFYDLNALSFIGQTLALDPEAGIPLTKQFCTPEGRWRQDDLWPHTG